MNIKVAIIALWQKLNGGPQGTIMSSQCPNGWQGMADACIWDGCGNGVGYSFDKNDACGEAWYCNDDHDVTGQIGGYADACIWDGCTECASWSDTKQMWLCNDDPDANDYGKGCGGGGGGGGGGSNCPKHHGDWGNACVWDGCLDGISWVDDPNNACGAAWYCNDGRDVWNGKEKFADACIDSDCKPCASWSPKKEMWVCNTDHTANDHHKGCGGDEKQQLRSVSIE